MLRRRFVERHGAEQLERLLEERLESSLAGWLAPHLGPSSKRKASPSPVSMEEEAATLVLPRLRPPALVMGVDGSTLGAALGADLLLEADESRLAIAREAFPEADLQGPDFFALRGCFRTLVAFRFLSALEKTGGFGKFREYFGVVRERLEADGLLIMIDERAYQDDAVCQLASLHFEIDDITPLADGRTAILFATKRESDE